MRDFQVLMLTCLVCVNEDRIDGLPLGWIHTRVPFGALELLRYQTKEKVWRIKEKGLVVISINNSDWSHLKRIDRGATFWLRCPGCCLRLSPFSQLLLLRNVQPYGQFGSSGFTPDFTSIQVQCAARQHSPYYPGVLLSKTIYTIAELTVWPYNTRELSSHISPFIDQHTPRSQFTTALFV